MRTAHRARPKMQAPCKQAACSHGAPKLIRRRHTCPPCPSRPWRVRGPPAMPSTLLHPDPTTPTVNQCPAEKRLQCQTSEDCCVPAGPCCAGRMLARLARAGCPCARLRAAPPHAPAWDLHAALHYRWLAACIYAMRRASWLCSSSATFSSWPRTDRSIWLEPYSTTKPAIREVSMVGFSLMFLEPVSSCSFLAIRNCCSCSSFTAERRVATWVSVSLQYRSSKLSQISSSRARRSFSTSRFRKLMVYWLKPASLPIFASTARFFSASTTGFITSWVSFWLLAIREAMASTSACTGSSLPFSSASSTRALA
mmetsp:Transcript_30113/g.76708  ORF Transcript_30113/g.76708 Transcript_30113/m.76708 type:complete len:311 (+) Transcript_30113:121-1053(+)